MSKEVKLKLKSLIIILVLILFSVSSFAQDIDRRKFSNFQRHIKVYSNRLLEFNQNILNQSTENCLDEVESVKNYSMNFLNNLVILRAMTKLANLIKEEKMHEFYNIIKVEYNGLKTADNIIIKGIYSKDRELFECKNTSENLDELIKLMESFYSFDFD